MKTILITVDSLRADHLSQYGYQRDTMPALDRLRSEGTLFENAFANGPYTRVSVPSFQTSRYLGYENLENLPTIGSVLSENGVHSAIVGTQTGINLVDGQFNYDEMADLGRDEFHQNSNDRISRRVDQFAERVGEGLRTIRANIVLDFLKKPYKKLNPEGGFRYLGYTSAKEVTDAAIEWLTETSHTDFFLWIHYMEAHRPFGVHDDSPAYLERAIPEPEIKQLIRRAYTEPSKLTEDEHDRLIDLYDSDIRYCSRNVSRLFDHLEEAGIWDTTNILFSSDHGEEFGEHGMYGHGNYPYEELIHVPLIVKRVSDQPATISEDRELVDIMPTILDLHGITTDPYDLDGENLFEGKSRDVISLGQPSEVSPAVTLRTRPWKYIRSPVESQLYHLKTDPDEKENVLNSHQDLVADLDDALPEYLKTRDAKQIRDPENEVDERQLEALGYLD